MKLELHIADEATMLELGRKLAAVLTAASIIYCRGELGAGKTTLIRGVLQALGHEGIVKSPTFTLVEPYDLPFGRVFHFDLYRLNDPQELEYIGIEEYFMKDAICLVEWPERGQPLLPTPDLNIEIKLADAGRTVIFEASSEKGRKMLKKLRRPSEC